jgi:hypothetical protein
MLRKCAEEKKDFRIMSMACKDLVAAEAHYHRTCYKAYTRPLSKSALTGSCDVDPYEHIEKKSYNELYLYIHRSIIPNKQITTMVSLTDKLQQIMISKGMKEFKDSTKKHVKRNIEKNIGDHVTIYHDNKGRLLVVPDTITVQDLVKENESLKNELELWKNKA